MPPCVAILSMSGSNHMGTRYHIQIKERIDPHWAEWFDGMVITYAEEGGTVLEGILIDQAALYGLISKVRDLGLTLISVHPTTSESSERV